MKKVLAMVLLGSMLMVPVPTYASYNDQNLLKVISFDKIKEEVKNRNYDLQASQNKVFDAQDGIDSGLEGYQKTYDYLNGSISKLNSYFTKISGIHFKSGVLVKTVLGVDKPVADVSETLITAATMEDVLDYTNYNLYLSYQAQLAGVIAQKSNLQEQRNDSWKSWIQIEMGADQMAWGAQQLYMSYNSFAQKDEELNMNRALLQRRLTITKLQQEYGMVTKKDVTAIESQLKDLDMAIKSLKEGRESIKGSFNLMLGQAFDTELTIQHTPELDSDKLHEMDYDKDLEKAITQSYNVRLQDNSNDEDAQKAKVRFDFDKSYKAIAEKQLALNNERSKLEIEQENWDLVQLKYDLGIISQLVMESGQVAFKNQALKVTTAKEELLKAYIAYEWLLEGISISSAGAA